MDNQYKVQLRHRGRLFQVPIYLGKQLRSFIYMSDWKILPMTAVIAALVSMVIRRSFFITMEGTLTGSFALTCVAIWNGCFNSIQVICRERATIKREHRSGMHVTSYVCSHMIYQACLCLLQSFITLYVCQLSGVQFPSEGFMTPWMMLDLAVTVFLISYASDMVSLFFSALAHTTTAAMTVMPFILIFQLVFSGSIFTLPAWASKISNFTISSYGLKCIAAQADYNSRDMMTGWTTLNNVANREISGEFSVGDVMDILQDDDGLLAGLRKMPLNELINMIVDDPEASDSSADTSAAETAAAAETSAPEAAATAAPAAETTASAEAPADEAAAAEESSAETVSATPAPLVTISDGDAAAVQSSDEELNMTAGELIDLLLNTDEAQSFRGRKIAYSFTVGQIMDLFGRDNVKQAVVRQTSQAMYNGTYAHTKANILGCWIRLCAFILVFAAGSVLVLEFIDKDKR